MFPHGFMGFVAGFQIAVFAFVGIELVGTAAAETKDPKRNLPKAINAIPIRVLLFYVGALIVLMAVTPWTEYVAGESPFIAMFALAGLGITTTVVNLVVLTSAMSSANSGIYSTSRMVFGLAQDGDAPQMFARLSKRRVPQNALFLSCILLLSGVVLLYAGKDIGTAFDMVTTVSAVCFMFVWTIFLCSYLKYRRTRPEKAAASALDTSGVCSWCSWCSPSSSSSCGRSPPSPTRSTALLVTPIWFAILIVAWVFVRKSPHHIARHEAHIAYLRDETIDAH